MKILYLTKGNFIEDRSAGGLACRYRNYYLLKQNIGSDNLYACVIVPSKMEDSENFKYFTENNSLFKTYLNYLCLRDGHSKSVEIKIINYIEKLKPDVVFYDGSTFGKIAEKVDLKNSSIIFFHNIETQYTWERVTKGNLLCVFRYVATRYCERKNIKFASKYICLNERDANLLLKIHKKSTSAIIPITFKDTFDIENLCKNINLIKTLLFVGSFFEANVEGILWFVNEIMPTLKCRLLIVGAGMEKLNNKISNNNVTILGKVKDLSEFYYKVDAVVMPIFKGGGMKVKTAEALMFGKTIFATEEALQGYKIYNVNNVYPCETASDFKLNIIKYFESNLQKKFNQNIRDIYLQNYETENYVEVLNKIIMFRE